MDSCLRIRLEQLGRDGVGSGLSTRWGRSPRQANLRLRKCRNSRDGGAIRGPVVGAAKVLADFFQKLYLLGTEWKATKAINKALDADELDIRLFRTYPLMGCYVLASATLSDLIPVGSFGTPGWMDYIENLKQLSER